MTAPGQPNPTLAAIAYARALAADEQDLVDDVREHLGDDTELLAELSALLANYVTSNDPTTDNRVQALDRLLYYAAGLVPESGWSGSAPRLRVV